MGAGPDQQDTAAGIYPHDSNKLRFDIFLQKVHPSAFLGMRFSPAGTLNPLTAGTVDAKDTTAKQPAPNRLMSLNILPLFPHSNGGRTSVAFKAALRTTSVTGRPYWLALAHMPVWGQASIQTSWRTTLRSVWSHSSKRHLRFYYVFTRGHSTVTVDPERHNGIAMVNQTNLSCVNDSSDGMNDNCRCGGNWLDARFLDPFRHTRRSGLGHGSGYLTHCHAPAAWPGILGNSELALHTDCVDTCLGALGSA